jgi:hypothetical protein
VLWTSFEDRDADAGLGEIAREKKAGGAGSDDEDLTADSHHARSFPR